MKRDEVYDPYFDRPEKPLMYTRWLVSWAPVEPFTADEIHDALIKKHYQASGQFRLTHIAKCSINDHDGIDAVVDYSARGANRHDIMKRLLHAVKGVDRVAHHHLSVVETMRINLDQPITEFPLMEDLEALSHPRPAVNRRNDLGYGGDADSEKFFAEVEARAERAAREAEPGPEPEPERPPGWPPPAKLPPYVPPTNPVDEDSWEEVDLF